MYRLEVELLLWNCGGTERRQRTEMSTIRSPRLAINADTRRRRQRRLAANDHTVGRCNRYERGHRDLSRPHRGVCEPIGFRSAVSRNSSKWVHVRTAKRCRAPHLACAPINNTSGKKVSRQCSRNITRRAILNSLKKIY